MQSKLIENAIYGLVLPAIQSTDLSTEAMVRALKAIPGLKVFISESLPGSILFGAVYQGFLYFSGCLKQDQNGWKLLLNPDIDMAEEARGMLDLLCRSTVEF